MLGNETLKCVRPTNGKLGFVDPLSYIDISLDRYQGGRDTSASIAEPSFTRLQASSYVIKYPLYDLSRLHIKLLTGYPMGFKL